MSYTDGTGISDQAMLISNWLTFGVGIQLFNIFGIVTNIINIICFWKIGFADSVNISLFALSLSDLGCLITMIFTCIGVTPLVTSADLPFIPQETVFVTTGLPHVTFTRVSSCITALVTLERCLCITSPLKVKQLISPTISKVINVSLFVVLFSCDAPLVAVNKLGFKYVPSKNKTVLGIVGSEEREIVEKVSFIINTFSISYGAFVIIVVCTTILAVQLHRSAKWRESVLGENNKNISKRNYKAAKMVMMISSLFIICFVPVSIVTLAIAFVPEMSILGKYMKVSLLIGGFCHLLESINSSVNIFFYYHMGSHYRNTFPKIFLCKTKQ